MGGNYSIVTRATGSILTAAIYNADHQLHVDNDVPAMMDDASSDLTAFRTTASPGTVGSESLPTTLAGELQRIRYALLAHGQAIDASVAQWYQSPAALTANGLHSARPTGAAGKVYISTDTKMLSVGTGASAWYELPFAAGTKMVFNQAAAPVGWTRNVDMDDTTMIITAAGTGGATGGSWTVSGLSVASHVHTMASHTHTLTDSGGGGIASAAYNVAIIAGGLFASTGGGLGLGALALTGGPSVASTDAAGPSVSSTGAWRPAYQYVLKASKD